MANEYSKHTWVDGEIITAQNLNNIENQLEAISAPASTSANGLMSTTDKNKLNNIENNANAYVHPSYTARTGVPTDDQTLVSEGSFKVNQVVTDATGHVTELNQRTITLPKVYSNLQVDLSAAESLNINNINGLPISDERITEDHVLVGYYVDIQKYMLDSLSVETRNGTLTIKGKVKSPGCSIVLFLSNFTAIK